LNTCAHRRLSPYKTQNARGPLRKFVRIRPPICTFSAELDLESGVATGTSYDDLTDEEKTRFSMSMHAAFVSFENAFYLHEHGTLEHGLWEKWRWQIEWYTKRTGVVAWWETSQRFFSEIFRRHVNELIASPKGSAS